MKGYVSKFFEWFLILYLIIHVWKIIISNVGYFSIQQYPIPLRLKNLNCQARSKNIATYVHTLDLVKILTQQTPKPMAQLPIAASPRSEQVVANRQTPEMVRVIQDCLYMFAYYVHSNVPWTPVVVELHSSSLNDTMLNKPKNLPFLPALWVTLVVLLIYPQDTSEMKQVQTKNIIFECKNIADDRTRLKMIASSFSLCRI